jgi:hypothetical protein
MKNFGTKVHSSACYEQASSNDDESLVIDSARKQTEALGKK